MMEKEDKFYITLDMGDRIYEFQSDIRGERDKWYEVLKNSRRTAKDIKNSITGKPRNLNKMLNIYEREGISKIREVCETEKDRLINNYKDMYVIVLMFLERNLIPWNLRWKIFKISYFKQ